MIIPNNIQYESGVYMIKNTVNGKSYVGSSKNMRQRLMMHRCPTQWNAQTKNQMYLDMQKYGLEKFECQLLEQCTADRLKEKEQFYIELLKPEYNKIAAKERAQPRPARIKHKQTIEEKRKYNRNYYNKKCLYEGKEINFKSLEERFRKMGIEHPTKEAQKYLVGSGKVRKVKKTDYFNLMCSYNSKIIKFETLLRKLKKEGYSNPFEEAKKYIIMATINKPILDKLGIEIK